MSPSLEFLAHRRQELVSNAVRRRHRTRNRVNLNVTPMPKSVGNISWEPGSMEIEWDPHRLEMSWEGSARPEITVTPYSVEIRLINGETVRVGENEAKAIEMQGYGKRVDKEI